MTAHRRHRRGGGRRGPGRRTHRARRWTDVTLIEQGDLPAPGGSSSHAPGLVFQANSSKTMTEFARYTVEKLGALDLDGEPCFLPVGGLEVATTPERVQELHRRFGWLTAWGVEAELLDAAETVRRYPLLDRCRRPRWAVHADGRAGQGRAGGAGAGAPGRRAGRDDPGPARGASASRSRTGAVRAVRDRSGRDRGRHRRVLRRHLGAEGRRRWSAWRCR